MGLFSKKKPKDEKAAGTPPAAMPSLGLPANNPVPVKSGAAPPAAPPVVTPVALPAALTAIAAAIKPAPVPGTINANEKFIPPAEADMPTTFELPDVKLEETGFIESPTSSSMSLVVSEPDAAPATEPMPDLAALVAKAPSTPEPAAPAEAAPMATVEAPAISLAAPDSGPAAISIAAPVTDVATPSAKAPEFKPPNISLAPPAPVAAPTVDGLKSQILPARAFRVVISTLHRVAFRPTQHLLKAKDETKLSNISTSGVGLIATDFTRPPAWKMLIPGSLVFESGSHPVQLEVMHVTSGVIGCRFSGDEVDGLREAIKAYFELELLALGMLKVNPAHHKAEADGNAHWIHGDQCELFYVTDAANKLVRFRLTFLGNRFVWTRAGGLNVGQVIDDRVGMMRTDRIAVMEATPEITELALRFLHNIPQVPQEHRDQIATSISPGYVPIPVEKAS